MKPYLMFAIATFAFSPSASAETYVRHTSVDICPDIVFDNDGQTIELQGWQGMIPLRDRPEGKIVFKSTWSPLTCEVYPDGDFMVVVRVPDASYPLLQVPDTAICQADDSLGNTWILKVHPTLLQDSDMACWERAGAWYAFEPTMIYGQLDEDGLTSLPLLSGHSYTAGTYQAKLDNGVVWSGVTCDVEINETGPQMRVHNKSTAAAGRGYCAVTADGSALRVPFEIVID